jgi:hypothetical protein
MHFDVVHGSAGDPWTKPGPYGGTKDSSLLDRGRPRWSERQIGARNLRSDSAMSKYIRSDECSDEALDERVADGALLAPVLRRAALRATRAPSVHNTQPWSASICGAALEIRVGHAGPSPATRGRRLVDVFADMG